uniref:Histidinol-phosphate aminotransferase n=1 Tax=candidate division WOR-3 bacterium TaxID=2052148 RepID=A0A7C4TFN6_UNCW3
MVKAKDYIKTIRPYKPGKPIEELIRELNLKGEVIKLASNENPLGTSPLAIEAMERTIKESYLYPDDNCFYLRNVLGQRFEANPEEIIVGNGSVEILLLSALTYLGPMDSAITSKGAFIWFKIAVSIAGAQLIEVPMRNYTYDLKGILEAIKPNTKIIYIDNPNNPTGTMLTKEEIDNFFKQLPANILVIMDEAYYEYITDPNYPDSFKYFNEGKDILILRTFSKIYGLAGLRLGYGFAKKEIIANLMKLRVSFNVNRISQAAGIAALNDFNHIEKGLYLNYAGKAFLYDAYKKLGLFYLPSYGNFIFVDFDRDSQIVFEALQQEGIITRTIKEYGFPNALRITIGTENQNRRLIEVLKKIL